MTGLYVIVSRRGGAHLARRRSGYRQVAVDGTQAYVREEHNSGFLGTREGDRVRISAQWMADIRAVAEDPEASFFFVEMKGRETLAEAIRRGLSLPVGPVSGSVGVDAARGRAADLAP